MSSTEPQASLPAAETPIEPGQEPTARPAEKADPQQCAAELKRLFPALFAGPAKPIKLRIQADIQERAPGQFSKQQLSAFLRRYTGGTGYLIALTKAQHRFDLDGQPAGELSEEHREAARQELARRRLVTEGRRAQEESERRNRAQLLRDFERTTLTPANFCALKGIAPEQLEPLLAQARQEAQDMPARPDRPPRHEPGRPQGRPQGPRREHKASAPPRRGR
ncbi:ProQ/FinO family protein [Pelomonas sp. CA6]|uniref:ProQ/FINO family protein n=1 Tax=Pelomonas sp. CA6 TaxID=2907999 RepID=UPI001F4C3808|nr:ProQ/FinO family protein [Pelomonas sp. CA6]MCH7343030.1 ProQ/FinO family protein [Pelomonas sp. CA6]